MSSFQFDPYSGDFNVPGYEDAKKKIDQQIAQRQGTGPVVSGAAQAQGFDATAANQARDQQQGLVSSLTNAAAGRGPSIAQMQFANALQGQNSLASSMAASAVGQGVSPAMAARMASQSATSNAQSAAAGSAMGRLQETLAARQQLGDVLSGVRGQDLSAAQTAMQGSQFNAGLQQQTNLANQQAAVTNQAQIDQMIVQLMSQGLSYDQAQAQARQAYQQLSGSVAMNNVNAATQLASGKMQADAAAAANRQSFTNTLLGAGINAAGSAIALSDERAKTEIDRDSTPHDVSEFLDALDTASWQYKDGVGEDTTKRRYGAMAQSVAKTDMGKSFVVERDDGLLMLDTTKGFGAVLAAQKELHERLKELEKHKRGRAA